MEETLTLREECYFLNPQNALSRFDFDCNNHITSAGKENFWMFMDDEYSHFEAKPDDYKPKKVVSEMNKKAKEEKERFLLPKPPPQQSSNEVNRKKSKSNVYDRHEDLREGKGKRF